MSDLYHRLRRTGLWRTALGPAYQQRQTQAWLAAGRPTPPPAVIKVRNLLTLADIFGLDVLVETGTYQGDTIAATAQRFKRIVSIEVFAPLAEAAQRRFAAQKHIEVVLGDSATVMPQVLQTEPRPILFWLDGHYSGPGTGKAAELSPIVGEIEHIVRLRPKGHDVIIIDDARCFVGADGYPAMDAFLADLQGKFGVTPRVADDSIFILPQR